MVIKSILVFITRKVPKHGFFFSGQYFHVFGLNTGITQNYTQLVVLVNVENEDYSWKVGINCEY